jgi:hypothetical protein
VEIHVVHKHVKVIVMQVVVVVLVVEIVKVIVVELARVLEDVSIIVPDWPPQFFI